MSVDDGNLTSTCMRVVAFLPHPHPPLVANDCARAQSMRLRVSPATIFRTLEIRVDQNARSASSKKESNIIKR